MALMIRRRRFRQLRKTLLAGIVALVGVATSLAASGTAAASATTYYASPTDQGTASCLTPANSCRVGTALGLAADGDTILMAGGTYTNAQLSISHAITLEAAPGAKPVLVAPSATADVLTAFVPGIILRNLTAEGGRNGVFTEAAITVTDSTMTGNAIGVAQDAGSGVVVTNSTLTGNLDYGITVTSGTSTVESTTINNNGDYGVIATSTIDTGADIIAGNGGSFAGGMDCAHSLGSVLPTDLGFTLDSDGSCDLTGTGSGSDSSTLDGGIQPLADNGGSTPTEALLASDSAVAAVTESLSDGTAICGTLDQRGFTRPHHVCDAGSYESQPLLASPAVQLAVSPSGGSSLGQQVTLTATTATADGAPTGTMRFTADGNTIVGCGAVSAASGTPTCHTSALAAGTYDLRAAFSGDPIYTSGSDDIPTYVVAKGSTTTTVSVTPTALTATVAPVAPATGTPTGAVTFSVNGSVVGSSTLSNGVATLPRTSLGAEGVAATYSGGTQFETSAGGTATTNPTITATILSSTKKTSAGWYRNPVGITFTCTAGSAPLESPCPAPVALTASKADQTVQKVIVDSDGGAASTTVGPINIDRSKPTVKVTGVKSGHTYTKAPHAKTSCKDSLSGIAKCNLAKHTTTKGGVKTVHYTATATDRAGNTATKKGSYKIG